MKELVEVYRGYEIHKVEKKGREMYSSGTCSSFTLSSARRSVDIYMFGVIWRVDWGSGVKTTVYLDGDIGESYGGVVNQGSIYGSHAARCGHLAPL